MGTEEELRLLNINELLGVKQLNLNNESFIYK